MNLLHLILLLACTISYVLAQDSLKGPLGTPWGLDPRLNGTEELKDESRKHLASILNALFPAQKFITLFFSKSVCDGNLSACWMNFMSGFANGTYPSEEFDTRIRTYANCRCNQWARCSMIRQKWCKYQVHLNANLQTSEPIFIILEILATDIEKKVMHACQFGAYNNALMVNGYLELWTSIKGVAEDPTTIPSNMTGLSRIPYPLKNAQGKLESGNPREPLYNLAEMTSAGTMNLMQSTVLFTTGLVVAVASIWV
ncbi:hypothetical protein DFS34DRAFT_691541 [Phlyctochytrium arcticum]|nr:hypothetical protein DFS34DRAFT_691541 [Phlyctochytrium arcticum]